MPDGDALDAWLRVRAATPWHDLGGPEEPVRGARDGAADHVRSLLPERAARLLTALEHARRAADEGRDLDFALLAGWQRHVLGVDEAPFRTAPAFAKRGRERYGIAPGLRERFDSHLAEDAPPLPRAARAYLDVCFFHPFADGNARAALLALLFHLHRAGIVLDTLGPLPVLARPAGDPDGPAELVGLLGTLLRRTRKTARPS
ncbi:Fic family protein [Actinomadura kijaniata]|uniref:Fic family protein n=1 Tax=Actinomadura kijaniata TaxID=46161 RepID=UPI00082AD6F5|nr:Fic family protein [Actinomadura kijaniata]